MLKKIYIFFGSLFTKNNVSKNTKLNLKTVTDTYKKLKTKTKKLQFGSRTGYFN